MVLQTCHPWEWFSQPRNEIDGQSPVAEVIHMHTGFIKDLYENAMKVSNMWPHGFDHDRPWCAPPPTKWRLDHVPPHILDSIIDWVSFDAQHYHHKHGKTCGCRRTKFFSVERPVYPYVSFVPTLKYLSMVNKEFRRNIFTRKIAPIIYFGLPRGLTHMDVGNPSDINVTLSQEYRPYTTQIVLLRSEPKTPEEAAQMNRSQWATDRNRFLGSLPNLDCLWDASMEVSRHNTIMPSKMFNVTLFLRRGTYLTCPLPVTEIRMLQIKSCDFGAKESIGNPESSRWPEKIRVLTQNIKKISNLQLSLPGLWTCGCSPAPRLEAYYSFPDPIPKSLPPLQVLALDIPFCSPTPGNYREAQWWGYLGWLQTTRAQFKQLQVTMIWTMEFIPMSNPDARDISTAMGVDLLPTTRFAWEELIRRGTPDFMMESTMEQFILTLFMRHKELEYFQLVYKSDVEGAEPNLYRIVIAERNAWGGVGIKDALQPHWPIIMRIAADEIANGFRPKHPHWASAKHQDQPGVARFTTETNPLGHTGQSFMDIGRMFGFDKQDDPPDDFKPSTTAAQLALIADMAADCRQESPERAKALGTLDEIISGIQEMGGLGGF